MLTFAIGKSKDFFFDRERVTRAMDAATRKALSKGGAFVRTTARQSIRRVPGTRHVRNTEGKVITIRSRSSAPGKPPYSHTGLLKERIFFAADLQVRSSPTVVIGPERINASTGAPRTLEFGGTAVIERVHRVHRHSKPKVERRTIQIAARPYMGPALEREAPKIPPQFRNSLRGGV